MSVDIGAAYIAILPSTNKLAPGIAKDLGAAMPGVGKKSGATLGQKMSEFASRQLKRAGVGLLAGAGAVVGMAFWKGFNRLSAIEQAEKKLKKLGYEGKNLAGIMDTVTASVTGTAFGLDEAATAAAGALGAGVSEGKDLHKYLTLVGDAASFANKDFGQMNGIFEKIRGQGKVMGGQLMQLQQNGLSAAAMIAEHMGISTEEVYKLASQSKISAEVFEDALRNKIGGQAQAAGDTVTGSSKNMIAALGRIGASALKPGFTRFPGILKKWTGHLDSVNKVIKKFVDEFEAGEGAGGRFRKAMEQLGSILKSSYDKIRALVGVLWEHKDIIGILVGGYVTYRAALVAANALSWAQYLWASKDVLLKATQIALTNGLRGSVMGLNAAMAANPIGLVVAAITLLVAGLVLAYKKSETFRAIVDSAWAKIKEVVVNAWENHIKPALDAFRAFVEETVAPVVKRLWEEYVKPAFEAIGKAISWTWNNIIKPLFAAWVSYLTNIVFPVIKFLWTYVVKPVFSLIGTLISVWWNSIVKPVFTAVWGFLTNVLFPVIKFLWDNVVKPVFTWIGNLIRDKWNKQIKPAFDAMSAGIKKVDTAFSTAKNAIGRTWDKLSSIVSKPIRASITFINSKLIDNINKLPGVNIKRIPGFAAGGWTGTGSRNTPAGIVHADEFVISKKARRALETFMPGALDFMNRTGRWPGYAAGGKVDDTKNPLKALKSFTLDKILSGASAAMAGKTGLFGGSAVAMLKALVRVAFTGLKAKLFDTGGILEHGSIAMNMSGRPEAVLTHSQWNLAARALQRGGGDTYQVNIDADIEELGDIQTLQEFIEKLKKWRTESRKTARSGVVKG